MVCRAYTVGLIPTSVDDVSFQVVWFSLYITKWRYAKISYNFSNNIWYLPSTVTKFLWYHIWYNMYFHWQISSFCYIIYCCTQGGQKNSDWSVAKNLLKPKDGGQVKVFIEPKSDLCLPLAETDWLQSLRFNRIFWMTFWYWFTRIIYVVSVSDSITRKQQIANQYSGHLTT